MRWRQGRRSSFPCPGRSAARSSSRSGALQSRGPGCAGLKKPGSRFCEARLKSMPHRARDTKFVIAGLDPAIHPFFARAVSKRMDTRVKPAYDAECVAASCSIFEFKFQTASDLRSRAAARVGLLVDLPSFEGRRSAERRALVVTKSAFRTLRRSDFFVPGTELPAQATSKLAIQAGFRPPFTCTLQPLKAEPRSGPGRIPKAPRVRACEAQPQAPHPTGSGYPSPAKLSLCPTSGSPLEAPLTGQDASRIRPGLGDGDKECEKIFSRSIYRFMCPG